MKRLIMTPGPTEVSERIRWELSKPTINPDLDEDFFEFYKNLTEKLKSLLNTSNQVLVLNGEGILGLEAACASLIEEGDRVLCLNNGIFGEGFGDFVKIYGGEVVFFNEDYRKPFSVEKLKDFIERDNNFKCATIVHCETPSGLINPIEEICPVLKKYGILTIVDAVSSIGAYNIQTDKWGIDVLLGGSQKCLSAPPGLTFLSISEEAWECIEKRKSPIASYYCNLKLWKNWYEEKYFPYTQPVNDLYGLDAAVDIVLEEGKDFIIRHQQIADKVRRTLKTAGFEIFPVEEGVSNTVTAFIIPRGVEDKAFRKHLWNKYGVMIAGSWGNLDGKVWRIGHMGENCRDEKMYRVFVALDNALRDFGYNFEKPLTTLYTSVK